FGVGAIRFVSTYVGANVLRRQQSSDQAAPLTVPAPMMRRAAGLHDDFGAGRALIQESLEVASGQSTAIDNSTRRIGAHDFEDVLCEINRDGRRMHIGLLLVCGCEPPATDPDAVKPGGVHPIAAFSAISNYRASGHSNVG